MRAGYGDKLRGFLSQQSRLRQLIDFGDLPVFQGVAAYPLIVIANKQRPQIQAPHTVQTLTATTVDCLQDLEAYIETNAHRIPSSQLGSSEWQFAADGGSLQAKIAIKSTPLKTVVDGKIYYGIKTGFNKAFVIDEATRIRLIAEDPKAAEVIKPYLEGEDIGRYQVIDPKKYVILIPKGWTNQNRGKSEAEQFISRELTGIYQHLQKTEELRRYGKIKAKGRGLYHRDDQGDYWWELRACAYYPDFEKPKITWGNLATKASFAFDDQAFFVNAPACIIPIDDLCLLALMNSQVSSFSLLKDAAERQNGYFEQKPVYVEKLPIPNLNDGQKAHLAEWAQRLMDLHKEVDTPTRQNNIAELERNINQLLYAFYDLTPDEIATIEGAGQ
ncbi:MAG: TaqI-like C-terminal specificity domain-containing protein, partial [Vampirovibrionales bacterium]|nr:TaqI-like C-terminal specificity domain-containing protein [Vampirovibrionales bacterium]